MKRREYKNRQPVLLSFEKDRWIDFIDLCDRERKSTSFKLNEMLEDELQKNALGERTPISIKYGIQPNKPYQTDLRWWIQTVHDNKENAPTLAKIVLVAQTCIATAKAYLKDNRRLAYR